ncbi:MAG: sporulation protein YunB, partial [bacterium]
MRLLLRRLRLILPFAVLLLILFLLLLLVRLTPLVVELALASATDTVTVTVNEVITEKIAEENVLYSDLVSLEKDGQGNITALVTNMAGINYLQSEITAAVVRRFAESDVTSVRIPLGSLLGGTLLAGHGPSLRFDILSVTNVFTAFKNEFSSAGINQTHHRIVMEVEVTLGILLAGYTNRRESITTEITVAET